jgi:polyhydroxybutyrate depolymerase
MLSRRVFAALALALTLFAPALPAFANTDIPPPPGPWGPGDYPSTGPGGSDYIGINLDGQNGYTREYKVHVPKSYNPDVPMPLVVCMHGIGQTASMFCVHGTNTAGLGPNGSTGGFVTQSDRHGFILVMPQGHDVSWNAGLCCQPGGVDDLAFIRAVITEVESHLNVDTTRIYAAGFSNGGFMAEKLACDASDIFAAIVDGSGGIVEGGCKPQNHVAVLQFHGTDDHWVLYQLMPATDHKWAQLNGCDASTTPARFPNSGGDTTCVTHTGCPADGTVTSCTIEGGGHCWYGSISCGTGAGQLGAKAALLGGTNSDTTVESADLWRFLSRYHR